MCKCSENKKRENYISAGVWGCFYKLKTMEVACVTDVFGLINVFPLSAEDIQGSVVLDTTFLFKILRRLWKATQRNHISASVIHPAVINHKLCRLCNYACL